MASTPAKRTTTKTRTVEMFEQTSELDEDGNYTAKIYGEEFKLSSDVNGWLFFLGTSGSPRHAVQLVQSLLVVEPEEGEKLSAAKRRVEDRFNDVMLTHSQSIEDTVEMIGKMMEAAGNDQEE